MRILQDITSEQRVILTAVTALSSFSSYTPCVSKFIARKYVFAWLASLARGVQPGSPNCKLLPWRVSPFMPEEFNFQNLISLCANLGASWEGSWRVPGRLRVCSWKAAAMLLEGAWFVYVRIMAAVPLAGKGRQ